MVCNEDSQFLSVRETAKRLAVHENTVRNWARAGILPTARLPGSRFHRFDVRDVERLRRQRGETVSSVGDERRTIGPELANATQLNQWAALTARDAQSTFPELVRRLVASTDGVTDISFRSGDGVSAPGWDGTARSTGTSFLPDGVLCFELGVGRDIRAKAQEEYAKRTANPSGVDPAHATFIFATARRWSRASEWEEERRRDAIWSDVRVLDADDLEGWLQSKPAVHYWISEHLGRRPRHATTLDLWWSGFQARTDPALPLDLFRAGRERESAQLIEFLKGPAGAVAVVASSRDDAIAFVKASLDTLDARDGVLPQPPLVISRRDVWDRVVLERGEMVLLPTFDDLDLATASRHGHHVLLPAGRDHVARAGAVIHLPRPHRQYASDSLKAAGLSSERAYELAGLARRSIASLVRALARDPRLARPAWSRHPATGILAPLMLLGAWSQDEPDTDVVSRMAATDWPEIERQLVRWRDTEDPPFVTSGGQLHLVSPEEAFLLFRDTLTRADLERWHEIALEVLIETDPSLELPTEERLMAGIRGISPEYSAVLRRGIADSAAVVGSLGVGILSEGASGADHARRLVREVLEKAKADRSGLTWQSLAYELPRLAEAAPDVFLDAVHDDLDLASPVLTHMFQDAGTDSWMTSSSAHTGLLWALETLCWSPDHLLEATRALARLHRMNPGGRLGNRPLESLGSVLVPWIHHTSASLEVRVRAIEQICASDPEVGWRLLLALWPSHHAVASPPSSPRYRDWRPESPNVPLAEWVECIRVLVRLARSLAGRDVGRWAEIVEHLGPLPASERDELLEGLDQIADPDELSSDERLVLWEQLRKEVGHHRAFPSADWSMAEEPLLRMQLISDRLEPQRSVERLAFLFDWRPDIPGVNVRDHQAYDEALLQLRTSAVMQTVAEESLDGLKRLARRSPVPAHLGSVVGAVADDDLTPELLTWLDSAEENLRAVADAWASAKIHLAGLTWLRQALDLPEAQESSRRIALTLSGPPTHELWDLVEAENSEVVSHYWTQMSPWRIAPEAARRGATELVAHDRPWAALDMLASCLHPSRDGSDSSVNPEQVMMVLEAALTSDPRNDARVASLGYEVGLLLDYLESSEAEPQLLARYEFAFFRLLDHHRVPRALFSALAEDAGLFVDLVSKVYRGKHEARRELDERQEAIARQAWWILNHWHALPGLQESGDVDAEHLREWVLVARLAFADSDRADIGDEQIGQVLAASPKGADDAWPHEAVRDLLEVIGSPSMEAGIHLGVVNLRGVTTRGVFDGGEQERELAARYRGWAKQTAGTWTRTSRILRRLGEDYEREAQRADARAEVTADTE